MRSRPSWIDPADPELLAMRAKLEEEQRARAQPTKELFSTIPLSDPAFQAHPDLLSITTIPSPYAPTNPYCPHVGSIESEQLVSAPAPPPAEPVIPAVSETTGSSFPTARTQAAPGDDASTVYTIQTPANVHDSAQVSQTSPESTAHIEQPVVETLIPQVSSNPAGPDTVVPAQVEANAPEPANQTELPVHTHTEVTADANPEAEPTGAASPEPGCCGFSCLR